LALLGCLLFLAAPARAGHYFDETIIPLTLLPPPPAEHSEAWDAEIAAIQALQRAATPADIAAAEAEVHLTPELLTSILPGVTRAAYPALFTLLERIGDDGHALGDLAKDHWRTRRPYLASSAVKALVTPHANPSYPSGHTNGSLVWAEVLGQLFPNQQAALRARADDIARHRVLAGMHYPADVEGGRRLALLTLGALWQSPAFRQDFAAAGQEVATHAK
jgi:acid phosphatase (class A)